MSILDPVEARHFCQGYGAPSVTPHNSFRAFASTLTVGRSFAEGTTQFRELRDSSLRESERLLFLAISNFRRSLDLLTPASSAWAQVTMYYASYFAASSLLGMFGGWKLRNNDRILDVAQSTPGSQQFVVRRAATSVTGSHRLFWDFFYSSATQLDPWIDTSLRFAIAPVSGDRFWQTDKRNDVNYDSHSACSLAELFQTSFRRSRMRTSLPGILNTQFQVTEGMIRIAAQFAKQLGLNTDALDRLSPLGIRRKKIEELILNSALPSLGHQFRRRLLVA